MTNERYPREELDSEWEDDGTMPHNVELLEESIIGHRIVKVEEDAEIPLSPLDLIFTRATGLKLTLDTGREVWLADTEDCCAYTYLEQDSVIKNLDKINHVILGVGTTGGYTRWHIYADLGDVLEFGVSWSCGNPFYYGYGFHIYIHDPALEETTE